MRCSLLAIAAVVACKATQETPAPAPAPSSRPAGDVIARGAGADRFEGTLSGHHFTIAIPGGLLATSAPTAYAWRAGPGRVTVQDAGPIAEETPILVARSPRTIVRDSGGLWVVTELVTTAGGHAFTCLHQQPIERAGSREAEQATARGVAACTSFRLDP